MSDHSGEPLLPVREALGRILAEIRPLEAEEAALDAALGKVLAEPAVAPADIPAVDRSAMDGYALRSADLGPGPTELDVTDFIPAGRSAAGLDLTRGQAIRIMTGAPLPAGADAVQKVELTEPLGAGRRVRILRPVDSGENIFRRGGDLRAGEVLVEAGARIRPAEVGALAAAGIVRPRVVRVPRVFVLSTGDEVVEPAAAPLPHQVRNSNGPAVRAFLAGMGVPSADLGIARDDPDDLDGRLKAGLDGDLLILIGGVSVGDRDIVSDRLQSAGVRPIFHRIAMKPGKPLLFGRRGSCLVFGLPGNPLSALTGMLVFVVPAVQAMLGIEPSGLAEVPAILTAELQQKPGREWYRLSRVRLEDGAFTATPVRSSGSGDLASAVRANAFVVVPAETSRLEPGSRVRAVLWPSFEMA